MNIAGVIKQYDFNLEYAKMLVHDLREDQMTAVPAQGLENHPAFTLGHLISGSAVLAEHLGAEFEMPESWAALFLRKGPGDPRKPEQDNSKYPSKEQLLKELEKQHEQVKSLLKSIDRKQLNENFTWRYSKYMPALIDLITFLCINHEAMHLGQVAAWRRSMGLPSALAKL